MLSCATSSSAPTRLTSAASPPSGREFEVDLVGRSRAMRSAEVPGALEPAQLAGCGIGNDAGAPPSHLAVEVPDRLQHEGSLPALDGAVDMLQADEVRRAVRRVGHQPARRALAGD